MEKIREVGVCILLTFVKEMAELRCMMRYEQIWYEGV
jgi:hypothetical protein